MLLRDELFILFADISREATAEKSISIKLRRLEILIASVLT